MKTYKGLLCWMVTAMIGVEGSAQDQTTAQGSAELNAHQIVLEREKSVLSQAMTAEKPSEPVKTAAPAEASTPSIETDGTVDAPIPVTGEDAPSTFDAARQKFYEVWGFKPTKSKSARSDHFKEKAKEIPSETPASSEAEVTAPIPITAGQHSAPKTQSHQSPMHQGGAQSANIPYQKDHEYAENQVGGDGVKLPPMPDTLMPMGRPKIVAIKPKAPAVAKVEAEKNPVAPAEVAEVTPPPVVVAPSSEDAQVTVSPFLQWVRENKEAAELARQTQERYKADLSKREPTEIEDVFLKIRFPYVGNQPTPPNGGAVIYTTPKK